MKINLNLPAALEKRIVATARALNLPVEDYILSLVQGATPQLPQLEMPGSPEEFMTAMRSLSATKTPASLSDETWRREAIYGDHA